MLMLILQAVYPNKNDKEDQLSTLGNEGNEESSEEIIAVMKSG